MNDIFVVPLTNSNLICIIDEEDREKVMQFKWLLCSGRARTTETIKSRKYLYLHTLLTGFKRLDHINRNPLDNRKQNLRKANRSQNGINRDKFTNKIYSSKYKGVSFHRPLSKWRAKITWENNSKHIGYYLTQEEAALAYNKKAKELFGEFAFQNVIEA